MPAALVKLRSWKVALDHTHSSTLLYWPITLFDNIQRRLLENGEMAAMIARGDIRDVTSNSSIFHNAITKPWLPAIAASYACTCRNRMF